MRGVKVVKQLGKGDVGVAYELKTDSNLLAINKAIRKDGNYVLKEVLLKEAKDLAMLTEEICIGRYLGELGIAPRIYACWVCTGEPPTSKQQTFPMRGYYVMDRIQDIWKDLYPGGEPPAGRAEAFRRHEHELVRALGAMVKAGVVHQDAHPGNIGILADGRVVLFDFGFSVYALEPISMPEVVLMSQLYIMLEHYEKDAMQDSYLLDVVYEIRQKKFKLLGNLGDELYPMVLRRVFGANLECHCTDDLESVPAGIDAIIVGGGDVVNPWFMDKVARLISTFTGPVYLLSVGIPYGGSDLRYLRMFDHVFVRTAADLRVASSVLPASDVTYYRDMAWSLPRAPRTSAPHHRAGAPRVALALAQPYFANNAFAEAMKLELVQLVTCLAQTSTVVMLLPFNTRLAARDECDIYINQEICQRVGLGNVVSVEDESIKDPEAMLSLFGTLDLLVAMRLHSIIFALMQRLPFVCMYTTQKVCNVLQDFGAAKYGIRLPVDGNFRPVAIDSHAVLGLARARLDEAATSGEWQEPAAPAIEWQCVADMVSARKRKAVLCSAPVMKSFEQVAGRCKQLVLGYTGMSDATYGAWLSGRLSTSQAVDEQATSLLEVCRLICYALTESTSSPCLWGLHENCRKPDFRLRDALRYIYDDCVAKSVTAQVVSSSSSSVAAAPIIRHFVQLTSQDLHEFADAHRAGWPYVVGGLMAFDAHSNFRAPALLVDTYVDRTFHWGHDALLQEGTIPYTAPWIGFVHHTFTPDHGPYNCNTLFSKPSFIKSLECCKCLIALSQYLADGLRAALGRAGFEHVGVEVLLHPTEPVPEEQCFTMEKLLSNPSPKLVQIGSWMRSAYAMYKLPCTHGEGDITLQRCILKGKECTSYMKPRCVDDALQYMLDESRVIKDKNFPKAYNYYVREMIEHIREQEQSVQLIERLSNDDYDKLLAQNVAFLRLIDCSACNTIIEAIVRSGVVLCNRHPAAEEYLGPSYPGFYDTLSEAAKMSSSVERLAACHAYMKGLDKARLGMQVFLGGFQAILDRYIG
ncbi:hypothetical protein OEZ85_011048 [Tetradesmus obliquus]|uniref:Protein kinase domain-containing protein n=1 Tax=Tetradesmus obliquus TaxID=3088 RepID=A0ABY8TP33_TETOB|nr:hypothetical protein OEZ85_011048 [Tetradesmus obliquus]